MENREQALNTFFVCTFNRIQALEEQTFAKTEFHNLSVREFHIIEAVAALVKTNSNIMTLIAERLSISVGALTTAVNVLVRKGYLIRRGTESDRRIVMIFLTENGKRAEQEHARFHKDMIQSVLQSLTEDQLDALINSLTRLNIFFEQTIMENNK